MCVHYVPTSEVERECGNGFYVSRFYCLTLVEKDLLERSQNLQREGEGSREIAHGDRNHEF